MLLRRFNEAEREGRYADFSSNDLTDIAEYFHTKNDLQHALEIVDNAIDIYPGAVGPLIFRARAALMTDENCRLAEFYADQVDDKTDLDYYYVVAEILIVDDKAEEAIKYLTDKYEEVEEEERQDYILDVATMFADYEMWDTAHAWMAHYTDKEVSDYMELEGRLLTVRGEYEKSEEIFNRLLDRDSFSSTYWNLMATTQFFNRKFQESITSCDYALAINPDDPDALLTKANALFQMGNLDDAILIYAKYLKMFGEELPDDADLKDYLSEITDDE